MTINNKSYHRESIFEKNLNRNFLLVKLHLWNSWLKVGNKKSHTLSRLIDITDKFFCIYHIQDESRNKSLSVTSVHFKIIVNVSNKSRVKLKA